jgi:hypothetical protein
VTESEQRELFALVTAAFEAQGTPEFADRVQAIEERWHDRYEFWLVRNRDRARRERKKA